MAVSKTQNERPAINALIDLANALESTTQGHTVQISNLQGALSSEISSRTNADTLLGNRIQAEETARDNADNALEDAISAEETAREEAVSEILDVIGSGFNSNYSVTDFKTDVDVDIDNLLLFQSMLNGALKFGAGTLANVQGNNYYDGTITYPSPYPANSVSFVFPAFLSAFDATDLEVKVTECDNTGFAYTVTNRVATAKNFIIGYLALGQAIS